MGLEATGRLDEAAEHYRQSLALNDYDTEAHTNLAILLGRARRYGAAKKHLLRALEIDPDLVALLRERPELGAAQIIEADLIPD